MRVVDPGQELFLRCSITALGGHGKTTLAVTVPDEWGRIGYIMADGTSKRFASIPYDIRPRLVPIDLDGMATRDEEGVVTSTSWLKEAFLVAQTDWRAKYPDMGVIVWDTVTQTAREILRESARKNWFSSKGPTTGPRDKSGENIASMEEAQKYAQPQEGDFGVAQQSIVLVQEWFVKQPMHVIALFQEGFASPDAKTGEGALYGPDVMGQKGPRIMPQVYDENLAIVFEKNRATGTYERKIQVMPAGARNTQVKKPLGAYVQFPSALMDAPSTVEGIKDFWRMLEEIKRGKAPLTKEK